MAGADYRRCDSCDCKVFYDARLNYEIKQGRWTLERLGDWVVLCLDCHEAGKRASLVDEQRALDAWHGTRNER